MGIRKELRDTWVVTILNLQWIRRLTGLFLAYALFMPSVFALMFIVISNGQDPGYILLGTVIFAVVQPAFIGMAKGTTADRFTGMLTSFKLLPISPLSYSLGVSMSSLVVSAPGVVAYLLLALHYGAVGPISWVGLLVVVVASILAWILFSGLGYVFAMSSSKQRQAQVGVDVIWAVLVFLSPAFYSLDVVPRVVRPLYYLNPVTYYSDLLRNGLTSSLSLSSVLFGLGVLAALSLALMAIMFRGWKWIED